MPIRRNARSRARGKALNATPALPAFLQPFFWESALSQIHPKRHRFYIIERHIEYGDDQAIH